jgi:hypothetical protein
MIALQRTRTDAGIPKGFRGADRRAKALKLLQAKRDNSIEALFKAAPWKSAKPQLRVESCNKCAYCESPAESQHGDVEHFRPKSIWWWLAMCYDNYLLSCQICNQTYKGDKFPLGARGKARGEPRVNSTDTDAALEALADTLGPDAVEITAGRTLKSFLADCKAEKPLLIHPCDEKPENFIIYEVQSQVGGLPGRVMIRPRKPAHKARIQACEECFGINRESLCEQRWLRFQLLEATWNAWKQSNAAAKPAIAGILSLMVRAEDAFAGMARYFVREVWKVPGV